MSKKPVIAGLILLLLVGVVGYAVLSNKPGTQTPTTESTHPSNHSAATITFSSAGFSPASTTVKSGDVVAIKNDSSADMQLASDPHPVHTDDTELNVGLVAAGQTKTFTVVKIGTYGMHNHLNPTTRAKITIQ